MCLLFRVLLKKGDDGQKRRCPDEEWHGELVDDINSLLESPVLPLELVELLERACVLPLEVETLLFGFSAVGKKRIICSPEHITLLDCLFDDGVGLDAERLALLLGVAERLDSGHVRADKHDVDVVMLQYLYSICCKDELWYARPI